MGRRTAISIAAVAVLAPITLVAGSAIDGVRYQAVGMLMVAYALAPFFAAFEDRAPQAREIVIVAVLCALAVASRAAFFWAPGIKPMVGIVMLSGIALGPQTGFLVGAVSAFVSNFMFGQGPWTPWQMFAFGLAGLVAGALAQRGFVARHDLGGRAKLVLAIGGAMLVVCAVGPILDTCSVLTMLSIMTPEGALAIYAAGLPLNCMHGAATFVTLYLLANPLLGRLHRLRVKFGLLE